MKPDELLTITQEALTKLREKLLDLSRRNRLLNFRETALTIRIIDELPNEIYNTLVIENKGMVFIPIPEENKEPNSTKQLTFLQNVENTPETNRKKTVEVTRSTQNIDKDYELPIPEKIENKHKNIYLQTPFTARPLERRCKRLLQESRTAIEETGSNLLYLAIGFLEWYEDDNSSIVNRAPLILIPVQIERTRIDRRTNCYSYVLSYTEEDLETNISLSEKLSRNFNLILPEFDNEIDPECYFEKVSNVVHDKRRWKVAREMVAGMFSFAKLRMYKDLDPEKWSDNCSIIKHKNIQKILAGSESDYHSEGRIYGEEYDIDESSKAKEIPLILDADSSQHSALIDAIAGNDLVIEGPPGTGKSQSITNLIAAALHDGKSVLFVAEKKAALEVVRRRLNNTGLGDFCLELHSHKTQKGRLHEDIKRRLDQKFFNPAKLKYETEDLLNEREKLRSYVNLINKSVGSSDETIYDILWAAERWQSEVSGKCVNIYVDNALKLTRKEINDRVSKLEEIKRLRKELPTTAIKAWCGFSPKNILPGDEEKIKLLLSSFEERTNSHRSYLNKVKSDSYIPLQLSMEVVLDVLTKINTQVLTKIPNNFDEDIAKIFLDQEAIKDLNELETTIGNYKKLMLVVRKVFLEQSELSVNRIKQIHNAAGELTLLGLSDLVLNNIDEIINIAEKTTEHLNELIDINNNISEIFTEKPFTISDFYKFLELSNLIEQAPGDIDITGHSEHTHTYAASLIKRAKQECSNISQEINQYSEMFVFSRLPEEKEIKRLSAELQKYAGKKFSFLSSTLRRTRCAIKEFLVEPKQFKKLDIIKQLDQLAGIIKGKNDVNINQDYLLVLGPLFKGLETDWNRLEGHISWAQLLRQKVDSHLVARKLIQDIEHYRDVIVSKGKLMKRLIEDIGNAFKKLKIDIDSEVTVNSIIEKIENIKEKLECAKTALNGLNVNECADVESIRISAESYISATHLYTTIESNKNFTELFGKHFKGVHTDTKRLKSIALWMALLQSEGVVHCEIVEWLLHSNTLHRIAILKELFKTNQDYIKKYEEFHQELAYYGAFKIYEFFGPVEQCTLDEIAKKLDNCIQYMSYIGIWSDYCRAVAEADKMGLKEFICAIDSETIDVSNIIPIYKSALYGSMTRELIRQSPELASFTRANYENTRKRFADLDKKIIERTRDQVAYKISERKAPHGNSVGYVSDYTELALIYHEIKKRKRHIPIRQLVRRSCNALKALKPCFMMSPMSVAQYLIPVQIEFDIVVMDEASQLKPEDALGAIARAKQIVIVGDPKQLPPTTFFDRISDNIENEEEITAVEDNESILDGCIEKYQTRRLRWHYRSDHESLIAFSNREFYDDNLIVFPSPHPKNRLLGVYSHYIEGATYLKGRNLVEAEAVGQAVLNHFRNFEDHSLGVATFNIEQRDLIVDILDKMQKQNPWLEKKIKQTEKSTEPFFVKNLENVQGDERDFIFISTTYGRDPSTGEVYQRFGPINGSAGWRRLNVIFTRAKKKVELFTSMLPTDIRISENAPRGARVLRAYLEYAQHGCFPDYGHITDREPGSDFEISVSRVLKNCGYKTVPQVGVAGFFIDIGVLHPERDREFILGVECDGAAYHSAKSVRDRDRLREEILIKKQWKIHRIWSTDWFRNRENEIQRLLDTIKKIIDAEKSRVRVDTDVRQTEIQDETVEKDISDIREEVETGSERDGVYVRDSLTTNIDEALRARLLNHRRNNIEKRFPKCQNGILRDEMIDHFVLSKPMTMEEFRTKIPLNLRTNINDDQFQFLEDIFEIIDEHLNIARLKEIHGKYHPRA